MDFDYRNFYVVRTYNAYDDYWSIDGIFLSRDDAENYAAQLKEIQSNVYVEEYDVPTDCVLGGI